MALFVAPAVLRSAFYMPPPRELLRIWVPLVSLAVVLVAPHGRGGGRRRAGGITRGGRHHLRRHRCAARLCRGMAYAAAQFADLPR